MRIHRVTLFALDTEARGRAPADFVRALYSRGDAFMERWQGFSYSHQPQYVEAIEKTRS
jgi:hypothetical protein